MELTSRVKALLRRTMEDRQSLIALGDIIIDDKKRMVTVKGEAVELTFKEYELLRYLAQNQGIVLGRMQIMDKLWGLDYEPESRALDMHIKALRAKLKTSGNMIRTVRNVGYVLDSM